MLMEVQSDVMGGNEEMGKLVCEPWIIDELKPHAHLHRIEWPGIIHTCWPRVVAYHLLDLAFGET